MDQTDKTGVRLVQSSKPQTINDLAQINRALTPFGTRIWSLDLSSTPSDIKELLNRNTLNTEESIRIQNQSKRQSRQSAQPEYFFPNLAFAVVNIFRET